LRYNYKSKKILCMNIAATKLELIEWITKSDDEQLLEQMLNFYLKKRKLYQQSIFKEVLLQRAMQSESDIVQGNVYTEEEMDKMIASW